MKVDEEAIKVIKGLLLKINPPTDTQLGWLETWVNKEDVQGLRMAIKLLQQESTTPQEPTEWQQDHAILKAYSDGASAILDKISAEIEQVQTYDGVYIDRAYVLEILDKYK